MADVDDIPAISIEALCPICGTRGWKIIDTPLILQEKGAPPGAGLDVQAARCKRCGFIALLTPESESH